jgi:hypothetical protein
MNKTDKDYWAQKAKDLRRLEIKELLKQYQQSLQLSAKTPREIKLEVLLEEELIRRSAFN